MMNNKQILLAITTLSLLSACSWAPLPENQPQTRVVYPSETSGNSSVTPSRSGTSDPNYSVQHFDANLLRSVAQRQLGRPYLYGGNTPSGFDCSGLVQYSYKQMGIALPRTTMEQMQKLRPIDKRDVRNGDLVFFRTGAKQYHVGIMIDEKNFIHAPSSGKEVTTGNLETSYWRQNFIGARRYDKKYA